MKPSPDCMSMGDRRRSISASTNSAPAAVGSDPNAKARKGAETDVYLVRFTTGA